MASKTEKSIKGKMEALGVYRQEFDTTISIYCDLLELYKLYTKKLKDSKFDGYESSGQAGPKKSPLMTTIEALRKDILKYQTALGLTPSGLKKLKDMTAMKEESTPLDAVITELYEQL